MAATPRAVRPNLLAGGLETELGVEGRFGQIRASTAQFSETLPGLEITDSYSSD